MQFDFSLAGGEVNETKEGEALLCRTYFRIKVLLGDKAYDTDKIRKSCAELGIKACIPPKSNRKNPAAFDKVLYKERRVIENMFGQLKDWHGIAVITRYKNNIVFKLSMRMSICGRKRDDWHYILSRWASSISCIL